MSERRLPPIVPYTAVYRRYIPKIDDRITVTLPGEKVVLMVAGVVSPDEIVVRLDNTPMMSGKSHQYRKGDHIPCRRAIDEMRVEVWEAISDHELNMLAASQKAEREREAREAREAAAQAYNAKLEADRAQLAESRAEGHAASVRPLSEIVEILDNWSA